MDTNTIINAANNAISVIDTTNAIITTTNSVSAIDINTIVIVSTQIASIIAMLALFLNLSNKTDKLNDKLTDFKIEFKEEITNFKIEFKEEITDLKVRIERIETKLDIEKEQVTATNKRVDEVKEDVKEIRTENKNLISKVLDILTHKAAL